MPEQPPAAGSASGTERIRDGYDAVAADYAREIGDELARRPFDRALLAMSAELADGGRIADLGCGPGHVSAFLAGLGADVIGVDLSARMLDIARERVPDAEFVPGDLRDLPLPDASPAGAVAFYSLIHLAPATSPSRSARSRGSFARAPTRSSPSTAATRCATSPRGGGRRSTSTSASWTRRSWRAICGTPGWR